jgi:hypothetical protein
MKRSVLVLALAIAGLAIIITRPRGSSAGSSGTASAEEKGPGIAEFMLVVHDKQGILPQVRQALAGEGPADDKAWKAVHARASVIASLGESILAKKLPDKGDKASWREKVASYLASAKALEAATASKSAEKARTEAGKLQKSCNACHKAHQEPLPSFWWGRKTSPKLLRPPPPRCLMGTGPCPGLPSSFG